MRSNIGRIFSIPNRKKTGVEPMQLAPYHESGTLVKSLSILPYKYFPIL